MLEEVSDLGLPLAPLGQTRQHREHLPYLVGCLVVYGFLWGFPLYLITQNIPWPREPFAQAWTLAHVGGLAFVAWVLYMTLDLYPNQDVRDHAVPLTLLLASGAAWTLEFLGPQYRQYDAFQFLDSRFFTPDVLGIVAVALAAAPVRILQGKPAFRPLAQSERERTLHLFRTTLLNTRLILSKPSGLVGASILVFLVALAALGPVFLPYDFHFVGLPQNTPPSPAHPLGLDVFGQDLLAKIVHSLGWSLLIGMSSTVLATILGTAVGIYSGYIGGWRDEVMMRLNDVLLSLPSLILLIILAAVLGNHMNWTVLVVILAVFGFSFDARVIRAQTMSVKERPFIERARAEGAGDVYIMRKHILPVVMPLVMANLILSVSGFILAEATLMYLGVIPYDHPSLGRILADAQNVGAWTNGLYAYILVPGFILVLASAGFALLGYAMDDILNPKLRRR